MTVKVTVPYEHDPGDLHSIYLGVSESGPPETWVPAFRDTRQGERVVWARFPERDGRRVTVWVRDSTGARPVKSIKV